MKGEVDIAILKGVSAYSGLRSDLAFKELMFPVASPALVDGGAVDLGGTIILVADDQPIWTTWLEHASAPSLADLDRVDVTERSLAIYGAIAGRGLAMGSSLEESAELADGRLVQAFPVTVDCGGSYYAVYPPGRADCPAEAAFMDWLRDGADVTAVDVDSGLATAYQKQRN